MICAAPGNKGEWMKRATFGVALPATGKSNFIPLLISRRPIRALEVERLH